MPLFTSPPHFTSGARWKLLRGKAAVFGGMPLAGQIGVEGGQIRLPRKGNSPGANRAAGSTTCSGIHCCLPVMTFFTLPPDFAIAAIGNLLRSQWQIARGVPLFQ